MRYVFTGSAPNGIRRQAILDRIEALRSGGVDGYEVASRVDANTVLIYPDEWGPSPAMHPGCSAKLSQSYRINSPRVFYSVFLRMLDASEVLLREQRANVIHSGLRARGSRQTVSDAAQELEALRQLAETGEPVPMAVRRRLLPQAKWEVVPDNLSLGEISGVGLGDRQYDFLVVWSKRCDIAVQWRKEDGAFAYRIKWRGRATVGHLVAKEFTVEELMSVLEDLRSVAVDALDRITAAPVRRRRML